LQENVNKVPEGIFKVGRLTKAGKRQKKPAIFMTGFIIVPLPIS